MPLYEYECPRCGKLPEVLQPMGSDENAITCSKCGTLAPRIMSPFNTPRKTENNSSDLSTVSDNGAARSGTAIRLEGGSLISEGNRFEGFHKGISMARGVRLRTRGDKFQDVDIPFEVKDE